MWILVNHVDNEGEAAVHKVVEDTTIFHERLNDMLEEVPHALAHTRLVVDQLTKACQALVCAIRAYISQSRQDRRLKDLLELGVHLGVLSRDGLKYTSNSGHKTLCGQTCFLVNVEYAYPTVLLLLIDAKVSLSQL